MIFWYETYVIRFFFLSQLALAAINLLSLWVDPDNNTRMILLAISLYGHFEYVRELVWYVPSNGDVIPDICEFRQCFRSIHNVIHAVHYFHVPFHSNILNCK